MLHRTVSRLRARARGEMRERGASAVEFALILVVLTPLLFGTLQYGYYFYVAQTASSAARETARRLAVGDCRASGEALAFAQRQANVRGLAVTYGTPSSLAANGPAPDVGEVMRVRLQANGKIVGYLPLPAGGQVDRVVDVLVEDDEVGAAC